MDNLIEDMSFITSKGLGRLSPLEERIVFDQRSEETIVHYGFRVQGGMVFFTIQKNLDLCRIERNEWLKKNNILYARVCWRTEINTNSTDVKVSTLDPSENFGLYWELGFQSDHRKLILDAIKKITDLEAVDLECKPKNKKVEIVRKIYIQMLIENAQYKLINVANMVGIDIKPNVLTSLNSIDSWKNEPEKYKKEIALLDDIHEEYMKLTQQPEK